MAKKETQKDKKVKELLLQLASKNELEQIKTVKTLKMDGTEEAIEPLVQVLSLSSSEALKNEIIDLLNTIKSTKVPAEIIKCLNNSDYQNSHQLLLASIWNTGLDYNKYMGEIASATIAGDFMHAMECITILENLEGDLNEDEIMEALLVFKGYLVDTKESEDSKAELIKEMVVTLQIMNDTI